MIRTIRKQFKDKTGEEPILHFKKTKTWMYNDNYAEYLEMVVIKDLLAEIKRLKSRGA